MEVFFACAVAAVGVACLVIATTLRARVAKHVDPLIGNAARELTDLIYRTAQEAHHEIDAIRDKSDRVGKESQESIRNSRESLTRTAQDLAASLSSTKIATNQSSRKILEMQGSIQKLQAGENRKQDAMSREIAQLQRSIRELAHSRDADNQAMSTLRLRVDGVRDSVNGIAGRLATIVSSLNDLEGQVDFGERELSRVSDSGKAIEQYLVSTLRRVDLLNAEMGQVKRYVVEWLNRELSFTNDNGWPRIVVGGLSSDPSTSRIVWAKCDELWQALSAKLLYRCPPGSSSTSFYLLWDVHTSGPLSERMSTLLEGCLAQGSVGMAALRQLRSLLVVMHNRQPTALKMGPVLIVRTKQKLLGGILPESHPAKFQDLMSLSPDAWETELRELDQSCVVELTDWADNYAV